MRKFNSLLVIGSAIALVFAWLNQISIPTEIIPTIVNGCIIATSTAIIFTGIFFTLGCSNRLVELQKKGNHPKTILAFLGVSSFFVILTFVFIMASNFDTALKMSFTGLILASGTFLSLLALLIQQLNLQTNDSF